MRKKHVFRKKTPGALSAFGLIISLCVFPAFSESFKGECELEYVLRGLDDLHVSGALDVLAAGGAGPAKLNGKWGLINLKGEWEIEPKFEYISFFSSVGLAPAQLNGKDGYINRKGEWEIEPQFDRGSVFTAAGLANVRQNGKQGVIDTAGNYVLEAEFDSINFAHTSGGIDMTGPAIVERGGVTSIVILPEGDLKPLKAKVDYAAVFNTRDGLAMARSEDGKYGYIVGPEKAPLETGKSKKPLIFQPV